MCGAAAKSTDSRRQRPCSTHETGIVRLDFASTSTLTLRMRFCFAPSSSSPSYRRTRSASGFSTTSSGTLPDSLVSRIPRPPASASSSVTYAATGSRRGRAGRRRSRGARRARRSGSGSRSWGSSRSSESHEGETSLRRSCVTHSRRIVCNHGTHEEDPGRHRSRARRPTRARGRRARHLEERAHPRGCGTRAVGAVRQRALASPTFDDVEPVADIDEFLYGPISEEAWPSLTRRSGSPER